MARSMVYDLYDILMFDTELRMAMIVDFGLVGNGSQEHSALQVAVREGATVDELDEALGNGQKISALIKKYADIDIEIKTPYDM